MHPIVRPALLPLLLFAATAWSDGPASYPLVAVEDGDTITIRVGQEVKRLQLAGIDAPEDVQNPKLSKDLERTGLPADTLLKLGRAASDHLRSLVAPNDPVSITGDLSTSDRYGRIPVQAHVAGRSLNAAMVADGYAVVLGRGPVAGAEVQKLQTLQQDARDQRRGLWGEQREAALSWSGQGPAN
ncbi:MAG: thermonuclease family protein [Sedimenticola sp.]|nr:thermonuclease family protein [Sedimenticola sp.]